MSGFLFDLTHQARDAVRGAIAPPASTAKV
jgi:hypothetical protein